MIISVTFAPRDLKLTKASWPGVSIKVTSPSALFVSSALSSVRVNSGAEIVKAPMDYVIAPYSSAHLLKSVRNASNNVVLPWSTCPMMVMMGARRINLCLFSASSIN